MVGVPGGLGQKRGGEALLVEDRSMRRASERRGSADSGYKTSRRLLRICQLKVCFEGSTGMGLRTRPLIYAE